MKITQPTPDELLIADFPFFVGGLCALVFLISACVLLASAFNRPLPTATLLESAFATLLSGTGTVLILRRTHTRFDRGAGRMTWSRWSVLGTRRGEIPFADIVDVAVEILKGASLGRGPRGPTYRVALVTKTGRWPLTEYYSSGQAKSENTQAALQSFLRLPGKKK